MNNKNAILAFTALALALSACMQRETTMHVERVQFQAVQADGPSTKTVLEADGSVFWSPGDAVSLFYGGATPRYDSSNNCFYETATRYSDTKTITVVTNCDTGKVTVYEGAYDSIFKSYLKL